MMSTRFSTARTHGSAWTRYIHTPSENSRLSDDLDVIVKSLTMNKLQGEFFILNLTSPFC